MLGRVLACIQYYAFPQSSFNAQFGLLKTKDLLLPKQRKLNSQALQQILTPSDCSQILNIPLHPSHHNELMI